MPYITAFTLKIQGASAMFSVRLQKRPLHHRGRNKQILKRRKERVFPDQLSPGQLQTFFCHVLPVLKVVPHFSTKTVIQSRVAKKDRKAHEFVLSGLSFSE